MKKYILAFFPMLFLASKCKEDAPVSVQLDLNFKTVYNNAVFLMNKTYPYGNPSQVKFTRFNFFMTKIALLGENNDTIRLSDAAKLDFTPLFDETKANQGLNLSYAVPAGHYTGIIFSLGVSDNLNRIPPGQQPLNSPLSDASEYWDAWGSYIFSKLEGSVDTPGNNRFDTSFTIHTGGAEGVFKPLVFKQTLHLEGNASVKFEMDLNKMLAGVNLKTIGGAHELNDIKKMQSFMSAFATAFSVK